MIFSKSLVIVLTYSLVIVSCRFVSMKPMSVISHWPPEGLVNTDSVSSIIIAFSAQANKSSVEEAFSVATDGKKVQGRISWTSDRILEFTPDAPFTRTSKHDVEISSYAEDAEGNSLAFDFHYCFRGTDDKTPPMVTSFTPNEGFYIDMARPTITIEFSEVMNETSVLDSFSCSPSAKGHFIPSQDGRFFVFTLEEDLRWGIPYTLTVSTKAHDIAGNAILSNYERFFTIGSDSISPTIANVNGSTSLVCLSQDNLDDDCFAPTRGIEKNDSFLIKFSEAMNKTSFPNSGAFLPAIDYSTSWDMDGTSLTIHPRNNLSQDITYTLTIPGTVRDMQENDLGTDAIYRFTVDGPNSKRPRIVKVEMLNEFTNDEPSGMACLDHFQTIALDKEYSRQKRMGFLDLYIETSRGASLENLSIAHSIRITSENAHISPIGYQVDDDVRFLADSMPPTIHFKDRDNLHLIRIIALIDNSGSYEDMPGFITINVSPDLSDSLGNKPLASWKMRVITAN